MNYWSWGGKYIGSRSGEYLYSKKGNPLGVFYDNELYDFLGNYIGEIRKKNRIIVNKNRKNKRKSGKCKPCDKCGTSCCDYVGYMMLCGYEDFNLE